MRSITNEKVKTYGFQGFREKFSDLEDPANKLFKSNSERFFCLKMEDINQLLIPVPPSKHVSHTLLFITSGTQTIKIGFEEYTYVSNEILSVPAEQIFSIEGINNQLTGFICQFHPDVLVGKYGNTELLDDFDFLKIGGNPKISLSEENASFVFNLFNRLQVAYTETEATNFDFVQSYLMALFCEMSKNISKTPKTVTASSTLSGKFKELIYKNIKTNHQVNYYASLLNVTPNHLNKSVKSSTGKPATKWIDETILLEAKYLLYQTSLSISEIAMQVGHEDHSYFSRFFKKHEGITPVQYRKMIDKS